MRVTLAATLSSPPDDLRVGWHQRTERFPSGRAIERAWRTSLRTHTGQAGPDPRADWDGRLSGLGYRSGEVPLPISSLRVALHRYAQLACAERRTLQPRAGPL